MTITIRALTSPIDCEHFQEIERRIWSAPDLDVVSLPVLVTVGKNGGGVIGAFADDGPDELDGMVGIAFWWLGVGRHPITGAEQIKACSHMAGVLPGWQGQRIGLRLKLAQRSMILEQGLTDWVTWTYDPLYRANGVFNINRLGASCNSYYRNVYGEMQDALNRGVPSDRCQVDWLLNSPHVLHDIDARRRDPLWHFEDMQILPCHRREDGHRLPEAVEPSMDGRAIAMPVPDDIAGIRAVDGQLSLQWRLYVRTVLEQAFAAGYTMVDCVKIPERSWHYILVREYL